MSIDLRKVKRFWLVHYYPAARASASWDDRRRHSRVRLFFDPFQAALFTESIWHSPDWRLLYQVEVERTGLGFRHHLPF